MSVPDPQGGQRRCQPHNGTTHGTESFESPPGRRAGRGTGRSPPIMDGIRHVVIACDTRQLPEGGIPDQNRGLMRKAFDAIFNFIGSHCLGEPFRNRLRD